MNPSLLHQLFLTRSARSFSPWRFSYLSSLPQEPGIYIYRDENNAVLYVGKSKNLKARISSYFKAARYLAPKTNLFVKQIYSVEIITVGSDVEAILLEARLINELQPKYNSRLRDDKSPLYVVVTDEEFPRVLQMRQTDLPIGTGKSIGPFLSSQQVQIILKKARHLFPYCNKVRKDGRPCFYAHIGLCPGVCSGNIDARSYRVTIRKLIRFLQGDIGTLRCSLTKEMKHASIEKNYEIALERKNLLEALARMLEEPIREESSILLHPRTPPLESLIKTLSATSCQLSAVSQFRIEGYDISNLKGRQATGSMVVFTNGVATSSEYRIFRIRGEENDTSDDPRMLCEVLRRRFLHPEWEKPQLILVDGGEPQLRQIQKKFHITNRLPGNIPFIGLAKGEETIVIPQDSQGVARAGTPAIYESSSILVRAGTNDRTREFEHLKLQKNNPGLLLLMHIRDEAHRFCRTYHHWLRKKAVIGNMI